MAGQRGFDPIAIVECSYALQGSESEWIDQLLEAVAPAIDQGIGVYGFTYRWRDGRLIFTAFASGHPAWEDTLRQMNDEASADYLASVIDVRKPCFCFSQQVARLPPQMREWHDSFYRQLGLADALMVHAADPDGGIGILSPRALAQTVPARETARWQRITAHMATALRLRRRIEREAVEGDEAVLSPSGSLLHATGVAKQADARERLRAAARAMDRARGPLRKNDPQEALELWRALCAGRWSLVDRFESDGRRFLIAHRNQPHLPDLRGLSQREASVAAFAQLGQTNKEIAYTLGISPSSVATHLSAALRKLGLPSRAALAATSFGQGADKPGDQL
jgi:DNA-binding CsgD family transcriptional regulator